MKPASRKRETAKERRARVAAVVRRAKAAGEKVPEGLKYVRFRSPTAAERARGHALGDRAAKLLAGKTKAAA